MTALTCSRCGQERDRMAFRPFPTELGKRVFEQICAVCWAEWVQYQQALINHHGLNLQDPNARTFLYENLERFLFTSAPPA
ncbi:MAG TPA: oxidative damage protection protein [Gemmatimonadales bacterium]